MQVLGINWVGITPENGRRLLLSVAFIVAVLLAGRGLRGLVGLVLGRGDHGSVQTLFWTRQGISLATAVVLVLGILSIWFSDPARLATAFGLVSAGLAFALQQVITSVAGYLVVLRGNTFTVGDRISMGGVRGDVMRLGFIQTTIMEMGQPPSSHSTGPGAWVHSRQFTGRIVSVPNSKIFADPVFNYTRDFPFIWEEMSLPVPFGADRARAESILLDAANHYAVRADSIAADKQAELQERFGLAPVDLHPRVYFRITENWLELTVRFVTLTHGTRGMKDAIARRVLDEFDRAGLRIASARLEVAGAPPAVVRPGPAEDGR